MATLKDIAEIAGVNVPTVSKALRGSTDISNETKAKIVEIAKQLNYSFKDIRYKQTDNFGLIGVICPEIKSDYYSQIISVIEEEVKREGCFPIIGFTNFEQDNEKNYLEQLLSANVSGIIFISESTELENVLAGYKSETDIPLVLISQNTETKDYDCIRIDDDYGVTVAVEHLIASGHKDICYIGDELSNTRMDIFLKVMNKNNLDVKERWIQVSKERFEECGYSLMNEVLKNADIPTAVLAAYDNIAIGAVKAIHDNGYRVPDDISVMGIDNIRVSPYYCPEITTVAGPVEEMGKIAVQLLFKKIKDRQYSVIQNIRLSPRLIERKSVKLFKNKKK